MLFFIFNSNITIVSSAQLLLPVTNVNFGVLHSLRELRRFYSTENIYPDDYKLLAPKFSRTFRGVSKEEITIKSQMKKIFKAQIPTAFPNLLLVFPDFET